MALCLLVKAGIKSMQDTIHGQYSRHTCHIVCSGGPRCPSYYTCSVAGADDNDLRLLPSTMTGRPTSGIRHHLLVGLPHLTLPPQKRKQLLGRRFLAFRAHIRGQQSDDQRRRLGPPGQDGRYLCQQIAHYKINYNINCVN
ncbi:hypothetical protein J6590_075268 [Homalodisca vitripennis]|nr:hypothetical protein J6590_075268 [Homalodisca vitripennis]